MEPRCRPVCKWPRLLAPVSLDGVFVPGDKRLIAIDQIHSYPGSNLIVIGASALTDGVADSAHIAEQVLAVRVVVHLDTSSSLELEITVNGAGPRTS